MTAYYNEIDPYAAAWLRNLIAAGHIAAGDVDERSVIDVRPSELAGYTQCHFFAGIGGWSLALRLAGWPDDRPVWTGSCPCQPFSTAGKGGGFDDERHLWPFWFHLIKQCRPGVVLGEQVASKDGLTWLDLVQADMEGTDYVFAANDFCAAGVGTPHIRQRLWFVAHAESERRRERFRDVFSATTTRERKMARQRHGDAARPDCTTSGVADANNNRFQGRSIEAVLGEGRRDEGDAPGRGGASLVERGGLADADGRNASTEGLQRGGEHEQQPQDGGVGGLEHAGGERRERREASAPGDDADRQASERTQGQHGFGVSGPCRFSGDRLGPVNGLWRNADWLLCRDGKWRPVEPGTFPLAHGVSGRVGRLRAYGNAIVPQVAAEFIGAYLEAA